MLVIIPTQINELNTYMSLTSRFARLQYRKKGAGLPHVIVLGSAGADSYSNFLTEFYHTDHGNTNDRETVIM